MVVSLHRKKKDSCLLSLIYLFPIHRVLYSIIHVLLREYCEWLYLFRLIHHKVNETLFVNEHVIGWCDV